MSSLSAFLHPEQTANKEVFVSDRFKENGKVVPFVIRPLTQEENEGIIRNHTKKNKKTGEESFDRVSYNVDMTAAAVVEPDLDNAELQKAYGVLGPGKLLKKLLYVGEFAALMDAVQELSGLDKDINEEIEEAKKLIRQGDAELNYAHYALQQLYILPSVLERMSRAEKSLVYASIDLRVEEEKRQAAKLKT